MADTHRIHQLQTSLESRDTWLVIIECAVAVILGLTACFGNTILCVAVYKNRALCRLENYYIISLAVTDLMFSAFCIPFTILALASGKWPHEGVICQIQGSLLLILACVSILTMAMISVNRYFKIVRSASLYQRIYRKRNVLLSIAFSWGSAIVLVLSTFASGEQVFGFHPGKAICSDRKIYTKEMSIYMFFCYSVVMITVIISIVFSYIKVFQKVRVHFNQVANAALHNYSNSRAFAEEVKITKMLFATTFAFFLCWTPSFSIDFYEQFRDQNKLARQVYLFKFFTLASSSAINPLIYGFMKKEFKESYKKIFACE